MRTNNNGLDNELYDIVYEWLIENSHIEPNFFGLFGN